MKKIILAAAITLSFATVANAQSYNNHPYAEAQARQRAAAQGPLVPWVNEAIRTRIPSVIVEPRSYQTRKYGTPIGWCQPVKGSGIGKYFGINPVQICNTR